MAQTTTSTTGNSGQAMPMKTPLDLFVHLCSDMYSAENIIAQMLGQAEKVATNDQLIKDLQMHRQQTEQHAKNLERVFQLIGQNPHHVVCHAAQGLAQSLKEGASQSQSHDVTDGLVIAGGCETEHLEIAAYTGLIKQARALGQTNVIDLLQQNLRQEQQALEKLEQAADQLDAKSAKMMGGMMSQQDRSSGASMH